MKKQKLKITRTTIQQMSKEDLVGVGGGGTARTVCAICPPSGNGPAICQTTVCVFYP